MHHPQWHVETIVTPDAVCVTNIIVVAQSTGHVLRYVFCHLLCHKQAGVSSDEVAAQILDIMGDAAFEHVGELVERR